MEKILEKVQVEPERKKPTTPWKPASFLDVPNEYRRPGYLLRWKREDELERAKMEGWETVKSKNPSNVAPQKTLIDGTPLSSVVHKRGLILCEMPVEVAEERKRFFDTLTNKGLEGSVKKYKDATNIDGSERAYGEVNIKIGSKEGG